MRSHWLSLALWLLGSVGGAAQPAAAQPAAAQPAAAQPAAAQPAAAQPGVPIRVSDPWIRWLPAGLPGAGYLTLTNVGSRTCVLSGAQSADYAEVSFHQTHSTGGMSSMTPVAAIAVKPHESVRFAVGGLHLMLMQPKRTLHPGDKVVVSLRFADGRTLDVPFEVRTGGEE